MSRAYIRGVRQLFYIFGDAQTGENWVKELLAFFQNKIRGGASPAELLSYGAVVLSPRKGQRERKESGWIGSTIVEVHF